MQIPSNLLHGSCFTAVGKICKKNSHREASLFCGQVFCEFPSLQILYLHGNSIKDIKEVDKLAKLKSLRKLALHGNSMDATKVMCNQYHLVSYLKHKQQTRFLLLRGRQSVPSYAIHLRVQQ